MENIKFSNVTIEFLDDYERGNFSKSKMLITQYFDNGTAVFVKLNEREVAHLFEKMKNLNITSI